MPKPVYGFEATLPSRTNATDLSDDELLLLDAIFEFEGIVARQFYSEHYADFMNTRYTHSLTDEQVRTTFEKWANSGILERVVTTHDLPDGRITEESWHLADASGQLWESERRPAWELFVRAGTCLEPFPEDGEDLYEEDEEGDDAPSFERPYEIIWSPSLAVVRHYLEVGIASGLIRPRSESPVYSIKERLKFSYKKFPLMHFCYVPVISTIHKRVGPRDVDWSVYETRRTWWRNVKELQTILNV